MGVILINTQQLALLKTRISRYKLCTANRFAAPQAGHIVTAADL